VVHDGLAPTVPNDRVRLGAVGGIHCGGCRGGWEGGGEIGGGPTGWWSASAASDVHAVGGAGGAESTEARWSRRGWRHVEIDRQTVTGEPEERVRKTKAGGHAPCTGP
jgi:hypothetical protein